VTDPAHAQAGHRLRMEWGPTGASAMATTADVAVVVDVLSFTTAVSVAVGRGITVHPFRWRDDRAIEFAREVDAVLALSRYDAGWRPGSVSLSPLSLQRATGVERLVLPSPNGSTICATLAARGVTVVAACLRNAAAVAEWLAPRLAEGAVVAVVPAGERWPDGSLRPAAEDLWGAGAVLAGLDPDLMSPEARLARDAYESFRDRPLERLLSCASGQELVAQGHEHDVAIAGRLHTSDLVPVLVGGAFPALDTRATLIT
jgi:2-phosphosulfolactate phosphatase